MPSYFPDRRNLRRPLGQSPGLSSGNFSNLRVANNRGKGKFSRSMDAAEYSRMMIKKNGDPLSDAVNFVSGGRKMGDGVTATAKNNVVGFSRGGVRGSKGGLNALVKAISTNITSNVENVQNNVTNFAGKRDKNRQKFLQPSTQKQVTNLTRVVKPQVSNLNKTVNNVRNQSFNTIKAFRNSKKDDSGIGLLGGMFGRLKDGFNLIKLLTNKKTQKDLSKSIKNLEFFFDDAYRVAFRLRKNLIKIFKALKRIQGGSSGGGMLGAAGAGAAGAGLAGLGAGLFGRGKGKTTPNLKRPRRGRGKFGLALGLGAGALGMGIATNALASQNPQIEAAKSSDSSSLTPAFIDGFKSVVDKFNSIVDGMLNKKPKPAPGGGSSSGGSASTAPGSKDNNGGGGSISLGGGAETDEEKAWLKTIRKAEGTAGEDGYGKVFGGEVVPELAEGKMTVNEVIQLQKTGKMPDRLGGREVNYGTYDGKVSGATGAYQFMPATLEGLLRNTGTSGDTAFTPKLQDQFGLELLKGRDIDPTKKATIEGMNKASVEWAGLGTHHGQTSRTTAESLRMYNTFLNNSGAKVSPTAKPSVTPGTNQSSTKNLQSKSIARTAPSQRTSQMPSVVSIPIGGGGSPSPQRAAPQQPVDTSPAQKTNPIPLLSSSDDDNFFAISSRLAYGIVE